MQGHSVKGALNTKCSESDCVDPVGGVGVGLYACDEGLGAV